MSKTIFTIPADWTLNEQVVTVPSGLKICGITGMVNIHGVADSNAAIVNRTVYRYEAGNIIPPDLVLEPICMIQAMVGTFFYFFGPEVI